MIYIHPIFVVALFFVMTYIYPKTFKTFVINLNSLNIVYLSFNGPNEMHSVFAIFTFDPVCLQKFSIVVIACLKDSMFLRAMVKSSACCIVFTSLFIFLHVNPSIFSLPFILIDKISATKRYNIAEIGHH